MHCRTGECCTAVRTERQHRSRRGNAYAAGRNQESEDRAAELSAETRFGFVLRPRLGLSGRGSGGSAENLHARATDAPEEAGARRSICLSYALATTSRTSALSNVTPWG